jgi:hypothetical protein
MAGGRDVFQPIIDATVQSPERISAPRAALGEMFSNGTDSRPQDIDAA